MTQGLLGHFQVNLAAVKAALGHQRNQHAFQLAHVGYVLVHNAPIFGTQSYLEFTPGYIVHKGGLFRAKQAFAAEDIASLEFVAQQLRIKLKAGDQHHLSLREVRGTRRKRALREQVRTFASQHQVPLRDVQPGR